MRPSLYKHFKTLNMHKNTAVCVCVFHALEVPIRDAKESKVHRKPVFVFNYFTYLQRCLEEI